MTEFVPVALFFLFLVHLLAFTLLGLRRRQWYYLALVVTFSLLSASAGFRWLAPEIMFGDALAHLQLRRLALIAACLSLTWTAWRVKQRLLERYTNDSA